MYNFCQICHILRDPSGGCRNCGMIRRYYHCYACNLLGAHADHMCFACSRDTTPARAWSPCCCYGGAQCGDCECCKRIRSLSSPCPVTVVVDDIIRVALDRYGFERELVVTELTKVT